MATVLQLARVIEQLTKERQQHLDEIATIDVVFEGHGITPGAQRRGPGRPKGSKSKGKKKVGRPPGSKNKKELAPAPSTEGKTGRRKKFKVSGEQSVLAFVGKKGSPTTAEIVANWKKQGRLSNVGNTLTNLVKDGKLRREDIPGQRGSRYSVS